MAKIDGAVGKGGASSKDLAAYEAKIKAGVRSHEAQAEAFKGKTGVSTNPILGGSTQSPEGISGKSKKGNY